MSFLHNLNFAHNSLTKGKITDTFQENIAGIMDMNIHIVYRGNAIFGIALSH